MELQIKDHVASVRSCLQYVNEEERPLEAVFVFPLPADAAVCHFSAKIEEREIVAEVQDRQSVSRPLLWQCSTTEPQEHTGTHTQLLKKIQTLSDAPEGETMH